MYLSHLITANILDFYEKQKSGGGERLESKKGSTCNRVTDGFHKDTLAHPDTHHRDLLELELECYSCSWAILK